MSMPDDPFKHYGHTGKAMLSAIAQANKYRDLLGSAGMTQEILKNALADKNRMQEMFGIRGVAADIARLSEIDHMRAVGGQSMIDDLRTDLNRAFGNHHFIATYLEEARSIRDAVHKPTLDFGLGNYGLAAKLAEESVRNMGKLSANYSASLLALKLDETIWPTRNVERMLGLSQRSAASLFAIDGTGMTAAMTRASLAATHVFAAAALSKSVTHELLRLDSVANQVAAAARSSTDALRTAIDSITLHGEHFPFISSPVAMAMANEWQMHGITDDTASLLDRLQSFLDETEAREEEVIKLTAEVRKLSKEQRGLSVKDIINYIFTLFIFFYQENSSHETEQRLTVKIEATQTSVSTVQRDVARIEALLLQILQQLPAKPAAEVYFVVRDRPAIVRAKPASGAAQTGKIMPNQQATLVGEDSQWIEIEYFDLRDQVQNRGWVLKKYLKRQATRRH